MSSIENYSTLAEGRKRVAVIFADVAGFTELSEKLDPEEIREIINECFNYITSPVYELEGTIDKYIGDCIMILFGARYAHADDAKRSVMCAVKMMELINDFSKSNLSSRGLSLGLSIGINYGLVVTGGVGNYFDRDYTVMGDIVNTAQRLQYSANEGTILVSESVYVETKEMFDYSQAKEVSVKNKGKPVKCYSPEGIRNEYFYENDMSFIERQREMSLLNSVYNKASNTGFKYVVVTGEAGMGKTRLLKEFTSQLGSDVKKVWTECNTFSMNRPYSLISGMLSGIMNINPLDSKNMRQHRLISFLDYILDKYSDDEIRRNYNFIGLLMGLERDAEFQAIFESMGHDNVRREILKQLALFFTNLCGKQKLVLVADDVQLADSASLQLLEEFIPLITEVRAVFILASRYGLSSLQGPKSGLRQDIHLKRLSEEGVRKLSCSLLNCDSLTGPLFDRIAGFAKGNPLYIRELTTSMDRKGIIDIDNGIARLLENEALHMPENIHNLIISNISTLDDKSLKLLQAASVIGREFTSTQLIHLMDKAISIEDIAGMPVKMKLIELKSTHTSSKAVERIFQFTHEVEREVIYDSLLNKEKAMLHRKIGEYLESVFSNDIENHYESLCEHFLKAGMNRKSAIYYYKSAVSQRESYNLGLALDYFNKYLQVCRDDTDADYLDRIVGAYYGIGQINFINANYDAALGALEKALDNSGMGDETIRVRLLIVEIYKDMGRLDDAITILESIGLRIKEGSPQYGRWIQLKCAILRIKGDSTALGIIMKAEKILIKAGDFHNLSEIMKHAGMIHFSKGDIDNALLFMNKSYKYAEKNNHLDIMAKVSGDLGILYHSTGIVSKALEFLNKSLDMSRKLSYQRGIIAASINLGVLYLDKGLFNAADKFFTDALEISVEVGSKLYKCVSLTNLGDVAYEMGEFGKAFGNYSESLEMAENIKTPVEVGVNLIGMIKILLKYVQPDIYGGQPDDTCENVDPSVLERINSWLEEKDVPSAGNFEGGTKIAELLDMASVVLDYAGRIFEETEEATYLADYNTYMGLVAQYGGDFDNSMKRFDKALEISAECRNDKKRLKALRQKGRLLILMNRQLEAIRLFEEAISISNALESDFEAAKSWFGLYKASKAAGMWKETGRSIEQAAIYISKTDKSRWTELINTEILQ